MPLSNPVTQIFLPFAVVVLMFALGTTLTVADLRRVLHRPRAFVLGVVAHAAAAARSAFGMSAALRSPARSRWVSSSSPPAPPTPARTSHPPPPRRHHALGVPHRGACLTCVPTVPLLVRMRPLGSGRGTGRSPPAGVCRTALGLFLVSSLAGGGGHAPARARPDVARAVGPRDPWVCGVARGGPRRGLEREGDVLRRWPGPAWPPCSSILLTSPPPGASPPS